jgi:hypothetical protein
LHPEIVDNRCIPLLALTHLSRAFDDQIIGEILASLSIDRFNEKHTTSFVLAEKAQLQILVLL